MQHFFGSVEVRKIHLKTIFTAETNFNRKYERKMLTFVSRTFFKQGHLPTSTFQPFLSSSSSSLSLSISLSFFFLFLSLLLSYSLLHIL